MHRESKIRVTIDFLLGSIQARRHCNNILKEKKSVNLEFYIQQQRSFKEENMLTNFLYRQKLGELIASRPALQEC